MVRSSSQHNRSFHGRRGARGNRRFPRRKEGFAGEPWVPTRLCPGIASGRRSSTRRAPPTRSAASSSRSSRARSSSRRRRAGRIPPRTSRSRTRSRRRAPPRCRRTTSSARSRAEAAPAPMRPTYEHIVYEGYGPGGVAVFAEALTDNRNRTACDVRHIFARNDGNLGGVGRGRLAVRAQGLILVDAGRRRRGGADAGRRRRAAPRTSPRTARAIEVTCAPEELHQCARGARGGRHRGRRRPS